MLISVLKQNLNSYKAPTVPRPLVRRPCTMLLQLLMRQFNLRTHQLISNWRRSWLRVNMSYLGISLLALQEVNDI